MADIAFELDMFEMMYNKAVAANKAGDIKTAKAYFDKAADLMESVAARSAPPLDVKRKERAEKLRYIARNLKAQSAVEERADKETEGDAPQFVNPVKPENGITFDDIIGLDDAKAAIHNLLIDPLNNPQAYMRYGIKAGGFILLEGPPGTGKTTFAKAAASELGVPFAEVNANALVDSYIGKTGKNIDKLFAEARALSKKNKTPVVLFIDELDFLAQKRGGENKTASEAVPTLIKQMDGFSTDSENLVLIAATNIKESLDTAVLSRFRNVIYIPLPTEQDRAAMFKAKLKMIDKADFDSIDFDRLAGETDGFSGRDITQTALDLKNALAARDAGLRSITTPLTDLVVGFITKRRAAK